MFSGGLTKVGNGTLTLSGVNTYTGPTNVNVGTLQAGSSTAIGTNSAVTVAGGADLQLAGKSNNIGSLAGAGTVENANATAANLATGGDGTSPVFSGTLQDGTGGGALSLTKNGAGNQTLSGTSTYTGGTNINAGTLTVTGSLGATNVTINSGGTLAGTGTIGTSATSTMVQTGGAISPGVSGPGTLTLNNLLLNAGSLLSYDLGTSSDLISVVGTLTLDGSLTIVPGAGFGPGSYTLFDYTSTLTNNGLTIANPSFGHTYTVDTSTTGQVNLIVDQGIQYWDGANTTANGIVDGGTGVWNNSSTNWTLSDGSANSSWGRMTAIFEGTAGTVSVAENVTVTGLQFGVDGYQIVSTGGSINASVAATEIRVESGDTATISAGIIGTGGINKTDPGTLVLSGANSYGGATVVSQGVLSTGSANTLPSTTKMSVGPIGQNNGAELDVNQSQTVASVTMGSISGTDLITIATGQTLTVTGSDGTTVSTVGSSTANAFRVGGNLSTGATTTTAVISGGGTLTINSPAANFAMDNIVNPDAAFVGNSTLDLTGLAAFNATVSNFRVGFGQRSQATLTLSPNNTITATTFTVGDSNGFNSSTGLSSLIFGQTNVINANTINFGNSKGQGVGFFNTGLTNPTLTIRGSSGGTSSANLNIAVLTATAAAPGASTLLFTAGSGRSDGSIDAMFNVVTIAKGSLSGSTGVATGTFEFDNGTVSANSIVLGVVVSGSSGTGTNTGTFNVDGGTLTAGAVTLGTVPAGATQHAAGIFNINGGTVEMFGAITDGGGTSALDLNGGTLDMNNNAIGSAAQTIDTLTLASGTLQNVAEINNGGAITKTTSGVLILTGNNTFTGAVAVSAGTLQVGSGNTGQSGTGPMTVNGTGAVLAGTGTVQSSVTVTNGMVNPGDSAGASVGSLTINGSLTFNPATSSTVAAFTPSNGNTSDHIQINGALTLNSNSNLNFSFNGYSPIGGEVWDLMDWTGALTLNGFNTATNLQLPTLTAPGLSWQVSTLTDGAVGGELAISIVPEPSRAVLLMLGFGLVMLRRRRR